MKKIKVFDVFQHDNDKFAAELLMCPYVTYTV
jgi:hypothetical protein